MRKLLPVSLLLTLLLFLAPTGLLAQLNGAYTINAVAPASATNYQNFASAISDMSNGTRTDGGTPNGPAVNGPVTFTVAAGTYNEQVTLPAITGVSATNTITFDGVDPTTRVVTWNSNTTNDYTWQIDGCDYVRMHNLGITNTGLNYGYGIQLINSANDNEIKGCIVNLDTFATSSYQVGIIAATYYSQYYVFAENLIIEDNIVNGGRYNIVANGPTNIQSNGLEIRGNTLRNAYYCGIYSTYHNQPVITKNDIELSDDYTSAYGMQIRYCSQFDISSNRIVNSGAYGLYIFQSNFNVNASGSVTNNMIGGEFRSTGTAYGIYCSTCRYTDFYHNSVLVDHNGSSARGLYIVGTSTNNNIVNNSFAVEPTGTTSYAFYISSPTYITSMDYNNYYSGGSNLCFFGTAYPNLAALQAGQPAYNANSQSGWPNYVSSTDLHTIGPPLSNWATNIATVTTDFDDQSRPLPPDLIKDVGADEFNVPPFDADITDIASPQVLTIGNNTVTAEVTNNGANSLNGQSIVLQYSTDGGTTWPVSQTFTGTTLGNPADSELFTFTTPWNVAAAGTYTICIRMNPQIPGDPDPSDQICSSICTGMGGVYTINSALPTGGTNYNSFTDAAAALNSCGINAAVTFNVAPGTYIDNITLYEIVGASAVNTVTFDGQTAAACSLSYAFTTTNNAVIRLDGADYVTFRNMTVQAPGTYGYGFYLTNQANYNEISDCVVELPNTTTSAYHIPICSGGLYYYSYGDNANYLTIRNNKLIGGYYGMRLNGISTSDYNIGIIVENNEITDYYYAGIYSRYQEDIEFLDNKISGRPTGQMSTSGYGVYSYYAEGNSKLIGNEIHTNGARSCYWGYGNFNNYGRCEISNNMFGGGFITTGSAYNLYLYNCKDMDVYHNSANLGNYGGYSLYFSSSTGASDSVRIVNNIWGAQSYTGGGYAVYATSQAVAGIQTMDNNLYYTGGASLANWSGVNFTDLASWQAVAPSFNATSIEEFPGFISEKNLHIVCSAVDNQGVPLGYTEDLDGDARSMVTPDIGADEYTSQTITMDLGPDSSSCNPILLWGDTLAFNVFQWGGGQSNPYLPVDTTGYYHLTVTDSNNCRASDSVMVTILEPPVLVYENDTISQCSYDSLDAGNPGSTFLWNTGAQTQTILPTNGGTFTVDITSPDGCILTDTVTLSLFADANAQLGPDTTFCLGAGAILDAGAGPTGTSYIWSSGANTQVLLVTAPGIYGVTVTSPNGCVATDSVEMNALLAPVVNLGPNRFECDQFTLDAGNGGVSYAWSNGPTTQTITETASGIYTVTVTNADGCETVDQVQITVGATPTVSIPTPPVLCDGQNVTLDAGNPGMTFNWSNGATTQTITVGTAGTYIVNVTDPATGCVGSDTVNVSQSFLNVNLGPDFTLCDGDQVTLDAGTGPIAYLWSTGDQTQTLVVNGPGTYSVQATDNAGCVASDDVVIASAPKPAVNFTSPGNVPLFGTIQFTDASAPTVNTWFWDFGDGTTSTQQNPTHNYVSMGTFSVCLTVDDGNCTNTFCDDVEVQNPVDVVDELLTDNVQIFPNPNSGEFNITFDLPKYVDVSIEMINMTGQVVLTKEIEGVRFHQESMDLNDQPSGIYFLRLRTNKGNELIRKIVVEQ